MNDLLNRFLACAERIRTGKPGTDYSVVKHELDGYEQTPLETALRDAADALARALPENPSLLDARFFGLCVEGIARCAPGVSGYRARMLKAAGDYDDESSPVAIAVNATVDALRKTAISLAETGRSPLEDVPRETWLIPVTAGCGSESVRRPFFELFFSHDGRLAFPAALEEIHAKLSAQLGELIDALDTAPENRLPALIAEMIPLASGCFPDMRTSFLNALARLLSRSGKKAAEHASGVLKDFGTDALEALLPLLCDASSIVRLHALHIIRRILDRQTRVTDAARGGLIRALFTLMGKTDGEVAREAKEVLSRCPPSDPDTCRLFFQAAESENTFVRAASSELLLAHARRGARFTRACIAAAENQNNASRRLAWTILGYDANKNAESLLHFATSVFPEVRKEFFDFCGHLTRQTPGVFQAARSALEDPDSLVRSAAAAALAHCGKIGACGEPGIAERELAAAALRRLARDPSGDVAVRAAEALMRLGCEDEGFNALAVCLDAPDPEQRRAALAAIAGFKERGARLVAGLRRLAQDPDARVRERAVWACSQIGAEGYSAVSLMIDALKDPVVAVRRMAAAALGVLMPEEAFSALLKTAHDGRETDVVRSEALQAIARYPLRKSADASCAMMEILTDEKTACATRLSAIDAIGALLENDANEPEGWSGYLDKDGILAALRRAKRSKEKDVAVAAAALLERW